MKFRKKSIYELEKCYSIAPLRYKDKNHILVAAEKVNECVLFDTKGNKVDTIWTEPGGVMTMVQVPDSDGVFLATHKFYSPNDSKEAKIVIAENKDGAWQVRTLVDLPHVHRFDIIERNGINYLIACTLKSNHNFKDDWSSKGKVYVTVLPKNLDDFNDDNQLKLEVIKDNMLRNHGYYRLEEDGINKAIISCDEGIFKFTPPEEGGKQWNIEQILDTPASDAVLVDMDKDGEKELIVISPFHGNIITIYKKENGKFKEVLKYKDANFAHSIFGGELCEEPVAIIGHREGDRNIILFRYDEKEKEYKYEFIDSNCGSANIYKFTEDGEEFLLSTNREINEVALYKIEL